MFKLKIYKNNSIKENIDDDIQKITPYFNSDFVKQFIPQGIQFQIDIEQTNVQRQNVPSQLFIPNDGKYDFIMYCYERYDASYGLTFNVSNKLRGIYLATDMSSDNIDYIWKSMCHEILHAITYKLLADHNIPFDNSWNLLDMPIVNGVVSSYFGNENPYLIGGNFYQQLKKISTLMTPNYFKPSEVVGLKPELVALFNKMRGECGFPFIINSGYRTVAQNASLSDSVGDSAHIQGLAVDLAITDSSKRFKLCQVAYANGINRLGVGKTFIHLDISKTLPQGVMWEY